GALLCAPRSAPAQQAPAGFEEAVFELFVQGLPPRSVPAFVSPSGKVLVPVRAALELTGTPVQPAADGARLTVPGPRGAGTVTLDLAARTLSGLVTASLAEDEAITVGGEGYVAAERVGQMLSGSAEVDLGALRVVVLRDPPFPAQERLAVGAARRRAQRLGTGPRADLPDVPFRPRTGGGVLEWGVSANVPGNIPSTVSLRTGLGVWGGMLRLGAVAFDPAGEGGGYGEVNASYHRVFPNSPYLRQVQIGDVVAEGLRAHSLRGVVLTNAPFARDPEFGELLFAPRLPEGWEYELYQGGQLLGFSAAGGEAVPVPLQYGSTPVQVRLLGPAGERVESSVVYLVPTVQLPAGRFQYSAGGGLCPRLQRCEGIGIVDLRYGVTDRLTVLAGAEAESDSVAAETRPYAGASLIPAPGWALEAEGMAGRFARASVFNGGAGRVTGSATVGLQLPLERGRTVIGGGGFSTLPDTLARWHLDGTLRLRRAQRFRSFGFVNLAARLEGSEGRGLGFMRFSANTATRGVLLEAVYESAPAEVDSVDGRRLVLLRGTASLRRFSSRRTGIPLVSAAVGTGSAGLEQWEARVSLHPGAASVDLTARWVRGAGSPSLLLGTTARLGAARARARVGSVAGRTEGTVSVDGGLALGNGARPLPLEFGGLGLTGVSGSVFHDLDGDGRLGAGDEPVGDAWVGVGGIRVRTDARGRYATWSVLPYQAVAVALDTAAMADPSWAPVRVDSVLRPSPHLFARVDFPLVRTREVAGILVPAAGMAAPAGVTVEVVRRGTGEVVETARTFSDGEFYFGRVLPGEYELRIAESSLRALGAAAEGAPIRFTVSSAGDGFLVEIPPIRLVPAG
ncbi:MAG TPA: hypothetical protein VF142_02725, partial [Longimicrobium sp.]